MLRFAVKPNSAHAVHTTPKHPASKSDESSPLKSDGSKSSDPESRIVTRCPTVIGELQPEKDDIIPVLIRDRRDSHPAVQESKIKILLNPFHLSLVLENKGLVAQDHLALEMMYLAYVRTSLTISSAGVGTEY